MNFDENGINNLKNMINDGKLDDVISKISPEMIENFSAMMENNNNNFNSGNSENLGDSNNPNSSNENNNSSNFDFSNIDVKTIMKMKSIMEKMNSKNDPRSNLLYSLKPYLRESKKEKLDQYANLLNIAKLSELFKNDNKGS